MTRQTQPVGAHASAGFSLVELLVATAVLVAVASAITSLAVALQRGFDRSLAAGELSARARSGLTSLLGELRDAGSGVAIAPPMENLTMVWPVVRPARSLTDSRAQPPFTAITVLRATGAQALLSETADTGSALLRIDAAAPSLNQDGTGGFVAGDRAVIFDRTRAEEVEISASAPGSWGLILSAPLRNGFTRGAVVAAVARTSFGLRTLADGSMRLVRISPGGAEQPVVDSVVRFEVSIWGVRVPPFSPDAMVEITSDVLNDGPWLPGAAVMDPLDADLLRVRRIDIRLRVEPAAAALRGFVADVELAASTHVRSR
jgi:prepilin-type N-terminal cleavage/methylation domain-containing protein